jgi:GNAT superfamily N-acetyltransferase
VRQPQRDARQTRRADTAAKDGERIDIRELSPDDVERVDAVLPLSRLDVAQTYVVAWIGGEPVGHAHIAWANTKLGVPEIQDVFVAPSRRRSGIGGALTAACAELARSRGHDRISIGYGAENAAARALYESCGFADAGLDPVRVTGTITIRGRPLPVDDTIVYLVKAL